MSFADKNLVCRDCQKSFVFSAGEQEFFVAKGLNNEPKRCAGCRILLRAQRNGTDPKATTEVNCASCAITTRVPFQPKGYRPVYCSTCFREKRIAAALVSNDNRDSSELSHNESRDLNSLIVVGTDSPQQSSVSALIAL